jgi:hypothetical protein
MDIWLRYHLKTDNRRGNYSLHETKWQNGMNSAFDHQQTRRYFCEGFECFRVSWLNCFWGDQPDKANPKVKEFAHFTVSSLIGPLVLRFISPIGF